MTKGFTKTLKFPNVIGMLYTLTVMLHSLTALRKIFQTGAIYFSRSIPNIEKTKSKVQWILDERKPLMLLKTDLENRLQIYNLKLDKQGEEAIPSMIERCKNAMLWSIDERFPHDLHVF